MVLLLPPLVKNRKFPLATHLRLFPAPDRPTNDTYDPKTLFHIQKEHATIVPQKMLAMRSYFTISKCLFSFLFALRHHRAHPSSEPMPALFASSGPLTRLEQRILQLDRSTTGHEERRGLPPHIILQAIAPAGASPIHKVKELASPFSKPSACPVPEAKKRLPPPALPADQSRSQRERRSINDGHEEHGEASKSAASDGLHAPPV